MIYASKVRIWGIFNAQRVYAISRVLEVIYIHLIRYSVPTVLLFYLLSSAAIGLPLSVYFYIRVLHVTSSISGSIDLLLIM